MPPWPSLSDFRACKFFAADPRVENAGDGRENSVSSNHRVPSHNYEEIPMAKKRICDACGERKKLSSGKTCPKGHFICYSCGQIGLVLSSWRTKCPLCDERLR